MSAPGFCSPKKNLTSCWLLLEKVLCCVCREDEGLAKRLQTRLDKGQQTAADALSAARRSEHECLNLQKQSAQLRERIRELELKQKVLLHIFVSMIGLCSLSACHITFFCRQ